MTWILPCAAQPSLAVTESDERFPVRRIFCVGQNYVAHAREMGSNPDRDPPFFFSKPADALVADGATIPFPPDTQNLHHEAELVVAIGVAGANISPADALGHVWGYSIGNDLTRRDLQAAAKKAGRPWDTAKGFDRSAPCGAVHPVDQRGHVNSGRIQLTVNDDLRQSADISDLIWPVPDVISHLSRTIGLAPGDLVFTGTPAGVGPLVPGDVCVVEIEGLGKLTTHIGARES